MIGPKHKVNPPIKGIHVAGEYIEVSNNARNISVIFYFLNLFHLSLISVMLIYMAYPNRLLIGFSMYKTAQLDW